MGYVSLQEGNEKPLHCQKLYFCSRDPTIFGRKGFTKTPKGGCNIRNTPRFMSETLIRIRPPTLQWGYHIYDTPFAHEKGRLSRGGGGTIYTYIYIYHL